MENVFKKAKEAYKDGDYRKALGYFLRLNECKMDLLWTFETDRAVINLSVANSWGVDRKTQIIVCSEDRTLYLFSPDKELQWRFSAGEEITSVMAFDINNDFSDEIIVGSMDSNIYVLNMAGELLWQFETKRHIKCISATSYNNKYIIIVGTAEGIIFNIKFMEGIVWEYHYKKRRAITDICIAEFRSNVTEKAIVAVTIAGDVLFFNPQKQILIRQFELKGSLCCVLAKDLDNDGSDEIIVCSENALVYCLDASGIIKWRYCTRDSVYSLHCCDLDDNKDLEIILGTKDGYIYILDSNGRFKCRQRIKDNVRSIFSGQISHPKFCDLLTGLSNRKLCYYKLIDPKSIHKKIKRAYKNLLNSCKDEFSLLESLTSDKDEYIRKFSIERMSDFIHDKIFFPKVLTILDKVLKDESPIVRSSAIKALINSIDQTPNRVYESLNKLSEENHEDVRNCLIQSIAMDYSRPDKDRHNELIECLCFLNKKWMHPIRNINFNTFDRAINNFNIKNFKGALKDFEQLSKIGLDLLWQTDVKGVVCCMVSADIDLDGFEEIILTSNKNILYVFDHKGKEKWSVSIPGFRNCVKVDDIDGDGKPEIILGCSDGTFLWFDHEGKRKGSIVYNDGIKCFSLLKAENCAEKMIVFGCINGFIRCIVLTGEEIWNFRTGPRVNSIAVKDIDNSGFEQIVAGTLLGHLFVFDSHGELKWKINVENDIETIKIENFTDSQTPYIVLGARDGHIYALDSKGKILFTEHLGRDITDLEIVDINNDRKKEIIVTTDSKQLYLLNQSGVVRIYSNWINSRMTSLVCCDIDRDGNYELIVGSEYNVYQYRILVNEDISDYINDCKKVLSEENDEIIFLRKDVFRIIRKVIETGPKKILMIASLGAGKTDLLLKIYSGKLGNAYIPVFIKLEHMRRKDIAEFLFKLSKDIRDKMHETREVEYPLFLDEFKTNYKRAFKSFIETVIPRLEYQNLLLLFDDYEMLQKEVINENIHKDIFPCLESLFETNRCSFIITGTRSVFELKQEYEEIFLNNAIIKEVSFINIFDARNVLSMYLKDQVEDVDDIVEKVIKITGCHAHFIKEAAMAIRRYLSVKKINRLSDNDWRVINTYIIEPVSDELSNIWENCSPHEKLVLSCISGLNETMNLIMDIKRAIKTELGPADSLISDLTLDNVLKSLTEKSILNQVFTTEKVIEYTFIIPLMKEWIKETKNPFDDVVRENAKPLLDGLSLSEFPDFDKKLKAEGKLHFFLSTINFDRDKWDVLINFSKKWSDLPKETINDINYDIEKNIGKFYDTFSSFAKFFFFSIDKMSYHHTMTFFKLGTPHFALFKKIK